MIPNPMPHQKCKQSTGQLSLLVQKISGKMSIFEMSRSVYINAGLWKERTGSSIVMKVWTGSCWSWIKVRITGRELPAGLEMGSPQLIRRGNQWWLHTPVEKRFKSPGKIEQQVPTNAQTKMGAVDLNINEPLAVRTIHTVHGVILS